MPALKKERENQLAQNKLSHGCSGDYVTNQTTNHKEREKPWFHLRPQHLIIRQDKPFRRRPSKNLNTSLDIQ